MLLGRTPLGANGQEQCRNRSECHMLQEPGNHCPLDDSSNNSERAILTQRVVGQVSLKNPAESEAQDKLIHAFRKALSIQCPKTATRRNSNYRALTC
jgi:hypothetical protein